MNIQPPLIPCRLRFSRTLVSGMNPDGTGLWYRTPDELLRAQPDREFRMDGVAINDSPDNVALSTLTREFPFVLLWQQTSAEECCVVLYSHDEEALDKVSAFVDVRVNAHDSFYPYISFLAAPTDIRNWLLPTRCIKQETQNG